MSVKLTGHNICPHGFRKDENCLGEAVDDVVGVNLFSLAVVHAPRDSVLALRIVFGLCLVAVLWAVFTFFGFGSDSSIGIRKWRRITGRRATRVLWQVTLDWLLAVDLLVMMLWRL